MLYLKDTILYFLPLNQIAFLKILDNALVSKINLGRLKGGWESGIELLATMKIGKN